MAKEFSWEKFWQELLDGNGAARPGMVALVLLPPALPAAGVATLHSALTGLVGEGLPYQRVLHIAPESLRAELDRQMRAIAAELDADAPPITLEVIPSNAVALVECLVAMPKRTAAVIHSLELFHGRDDTRNLPAITTWSGANVTLATLDERQGAQVGATVERLVPLAEAGELLIVAHTGLSSGAAKAFTPALRSRNNFAVKGGMRLEERHNALLARLLTRMNAGTLSLEEARARARRAFGEPELQAQAETHLLFAAQRFDEAWRVLEPHLDAYKNAPAAQYLAIARAALAAFHHQIARDWLQRGVAAEPRSYFELHSAWLLARELDDVPLAESLFAKLAFIHADDPMVLQELAERSLRAWKYAEAATYARRAGLHFYAAVWDAFAGGDFDVETVLRLARHDEDRAYIYLRVGLHAEHHGDIESAVWHAKRVPESSEFFDQAIALRLRMLGIGMLYQKEANDDDLDELMPLLTAVAVAPTRRKSRHALETLAEETLGEFSILTLFPTACERLLIDLLPAAHRAPRAIHFSFNGDEMADPDEVLDFSKELTATASTGVLMIGHGELPAALKVRTTPAMVRAQIFITQKIASEDFDLKVATVRLWEMELMCRTLGDPSKDGMVAMQLVRGLVRQGANQTARDLAEEVLRAFPDTQPMHRRWRTGLAWMVVAEAFVRAGNPMAALRCAALMLAAWHSSVRETEVFCEGLNLLGRIYRDLHITPLAQRCWEEEKRLRMRCGATELMWQLEAQMLDIEYQMLPDYGRSTLLRYFVKILRTWRKLPERAEQVPLLSRAISIGRSLQKLGATLPTSLVDELIGGLTDETAPTVAVLRRMLNAPPRRDEFLEIVRRFDSAIRDDDLKTQLSTLGILAEDTVEAAARDGDADRFLAAFGVLAQPVLTIARSVPADALEGDITALHRHALETVVALDRGAIADMDAVLKRVGRPRQRKIVSACEITAAQLAASLQPGEVVLLLSHIGSGDLCACQIRADGASWLWLAPAESWSEARFRRWQRRFPTSYRHSGAPGAAGWSREQLRETLVGLDLYLIDKSSRIIVIPTAELFLFPFALATRWHSLGFAGDDSFSLPAPGAMFLGEESLVSVVPSPQWLIANRADESTHRPARMAWVGSPQTHDGLLKELREALRWQFGAHGIELIESERPAGMAGASLAIIVAHGTRGEGREFHALGDGINQFGSAEVANWVEGCACVIVAACHGGAATEHRHSHETRGLVSAILSAGVRTVIACPWPLGADVIHTWLPGFLYAISAGATVADAAYSGATQVRANIADAAAFFALQVFGEGGLRLPVLAPPEA